MLRKVNRLLSVLIAVAIVLTACAAPTAAPTTAPTQAPSNSGSAPTKAPEPTKPAATAAPTAVIVPTAIPGKKVVTWWSHWANEPAKVAVIEAIVKDYEAAHPDVDIVLVWWDKNPLADAVRNTMTAGKGAPDIITFDTERSEWVKAGWMMDLENVIPWANLIPAAKLDGTYTGIKGIYKFNIGATSNMILYNREIFAKLGIKVPDDFQFTQDEFVDVVTKCKAGGYAGVANAIGNRPYATRYPTEWALFNLVGPDEYGAYQRGEKSWNTPEARQAINFTADLTKAGMWPGSLATMTIDEFHVYFHTQQKACMFYIPTWYSGRAFKPEKEGGQSPNFQFGMLRYPEMKGARNNNGFLAGFESGYGILTSTKVADLAQDILAFAAQPKYGALWVAVTNSPSAIKYDPAKDLPKGVDSTTWKWYWDEYAKVYGSLQVQTPLVTRCGEMEDAFKTVLNEGIPQAMITVDEAVKMLDAKLCKK